MSAIPKRFRVAAVQLTSGRDRERNINRASELISEAAALGARMVVLPENFTFMGEDGEKRLVAETVDDGPGVSFLRSAAVEHQITVVGGSLPLAVESDLRVTNTTLVFARDGSLLCRYDKRHLFDISLDEEINYRESASIKPGVDLAWFDAGDFRVGCSICYDLRFPEHYRALAAAGVNVMVVPAAFTVPTGSDHWEVLLRSRAIENQAYVIASAQYGVHSATRRTYGRSMIIDPWGNILAQAQDREGVIVSDLDFTYLDSIRQKMPVLQHRREARAG